ncbi:nickel-responsive transcriptional regulator NikR [Acetomicrobium sp. UBA5826]|uniref:nickel-responsive transcriptional regulator NikR n=1 Tax=Acetomicrobium sp. UBA5826 TaxID=1946039 RepID=UPI0025794E61|nr:nickel-responsive transcriptional regulator NikR [Acetomicrobium sp. UBA5826]
MEELVRFSISIPKSLLDEFERWLHNHGMVNRSEALRQMMRSFIAQSKWESQEGIVSGTVTVIYDHHRHDAVSEITSIQHKYGHIIVCTTHVHIDHSNCLEAIILLGEIDEIKRFLIDLNSLKGIKEIRTSMVNI